MSLVVEHRENVFFTGSAGTGKSVLLRELIAALKQRHSDKPGRVAVTASTGLAACNIGGTTIHSWAGVGTGKQPVAELIERISRRGGREKWLQTTVLVVDEISMLDGDFFDKLEEIACTVRKTKRPFGGIQLVLTGDFFQLPPVTRRGTTTTFAFEARTWHTCIRRNVRLRQVFRQKDPEFASMLNELREGKMSTNTIERFRGLQRPISYEDGLEATELFPTRAEVNRANAGRMKALVGQEMTFVAQDGGAEGDETERQSLIEKNCMAPSVIELKKGCLVILIKNIDTSLVNGSKGIVLAFMNELMFEDYQEDPGAYRARLEGRENTPETQARLWELGNINRPKYPLVRFTSPDGPDREVLCQQEVWKIEGPDGKVQASRQQIPLVLGWALSIHKSQGQTLERVIVNLERVFEKGQAYVALSRATSLQGLQIHKFAPERVMVDGRVVDFENTLRNPKNADSSHSVSSSRLKILNGANDYERNFVQV